MRCGVDLVLVSRITGLLARRDAALDALFSDREVLDAQRGGAELSSAVAQRRLAARYAAKEATIKALRRRDLGPLDIEIRTLPSGAPEVWINQRPTTLAVSLSHDGDHAMAFVVCPTPGPFEPTKEYADVAG